MKSCLFFMLSVCVALSACGFHLRGLQQELPFASVAVTGDSELARRLKQQIEHLEGTRLSPDVKTAAANIVIRRETIEKRIIALTQGGKVAEYQLRYTAEFAVYGAYAEELQAPAEIELRSDFPYDDQQTLAKEAEEKRLVDNLRRQAVDTILRRISALHGRPLVAPGR